MENRVCDLEQLEERDPEDRGRRVGTVVMATLGMVGLTFAVGVVVGNAADANNGSKKDPLDQLDRVAAASVQPQSAEAAEKPSPVVAAPNVVNAADLSFPKSLTDDEERPEVIAALEAAAREEATLDGSAVATPSAAPALKPAASLALSNAPNTLKPSVQATADDDGADDRAAAADEPAEDPRAQNTLPAAVAAGSAGRKLAREAKHDPLVAAALPEANPRERAAHGEAGEYTLQVISYDAPAPAQSFASALRAKGYEAFVTQADVPDRGRYYRVRIGPFANRERAEAYRHKFEEQEHMNIIVVKKQKDDDR